MRGLVLALVLLVPVLAGCTDAPAARPDPLEPASGGEGDTTPGSPAPTTPTPTTPSGSGGNSTPPPQDGGNGTAPPADEGDAKEDEPPTATVTWPPLDSATVRPGVQVIAGNSQCTSNFVFTSPDARHIYLGLAAHCVDGMPLGTPVRIDGDTATGTLAYSSWHTMAELKEKDGNIVDKNDFALIRVDDAHRDKVHPAMRHFGGPTALAPSGGAGLGDKVLTYGNSGIRGQIEPLSWHEGFVLDHSNPWEAIIYTATPGVPGDSGSGVMTGDGRALGILVTLIYTPTPASNGVTSLDMALRYAKENAGIDARLATWDLLDRGVLPLA